MSIDIEKHIETLKKEAVKYWGESEQNGLIQRTLQALEQLQKEIQENNLIIRELICCIDQKASKSHMQRTINKAMKISNTRGSIVL
jgi:hypothetical protein